MFLSNPDAFSVLFRHVSMVNLEPSVGVTKAIRPSVPGLATPSMPISESALCLYSHSLCFPFMPLTGDFFPSFVPVRCLAFEVKSLSVWKVRPLSVLCRLDLCEQAIHMNSQREDSCNYAHSAIELKTWMVQGRTGEDRHRKYNHHSVTALICYLAVVCSFNSVCIYRHQP